MWDTEVATDLSWGKKKFPDMITLQSSNQSSFCFDPDFWIMNILFQAIKLLNLFWRVRAIRDKLL